MASVEKVLQIYHPSPLEPGQFHEAGICQGTISTNCRENLVERATLDGLSINDSDSDSEMNERCNTL